jgi:hypothetical protein
VATLDMLATLEASDVNKVKAAFFLLADAPRSVWSRHKYCSGHRISCRRMRCNKLRPCSATDWNLISEIPVPEPADPPGLAPEFLLHH